MNVRYPALVLIVSEEHAFSHLPTPSQARDAIFLLLLAESKELSFLPLRSALHYGALALPWDQNLQGDGKCRLCNAFRNPGKIVRV